MRKRLTKKILSMFTAFLLALSMLTVSIYADTEAISDIPAVQAEEQTPETSEDAAPSQDETAVSEEADGAEKAAQEDIASDNTEVATDEETSATEAAADETESAAETVIVEAAPVADESEAEVPDEKESVVSDEEAENEDTSKEEVVFEKKAEEKTDEEPAAKGEIKEFEKTPVAKAEKKGDKKAADSEALQITKNNWKKIGYIEEKEATIYYVALNELTDDNTIVRFSELSMEFGMITPILSAGIESAVDESDTVDLSATGYSISYDNLMKGYGDFLDPAACKGLDFSNIYGVYVVDDDDEKYYFIIQGKSNETIDVSFTLDKGTVVSFEENGLSYSYQDWMTGENVNVTIDLYTVVGIPIATDAVNLGFDMEVLAYGYGDAGKTDFIAPCGAEGDGSYANGGQTGQPAAIVRAQEDGMLPAYLFVQTPYDENWSSKDLFAIRFIPSYTFKASFKGEELTDITFEPDAYEYYDYMAGTTVTVGVYTITIPDEAESIDFVLSNPVLHYSYTKDGEYLGGWVKDPSLGDTLFSQVVDYGDSQMPADGQIDYIQIQSPYDSLWNSELYYVITFLYESGNPDPDQKPEDIPQDVVDIYTNVGEAQNTFMADEAHDIYSAEWIAMELARAGFTVPDAYYEDVLNTVESKEGKLDTSKYDYTNYARVILALTAGGKDPRNVGGYDLTEALADYDAIMNQGLNGAIYALLALDSGNFEIPTVADGKTQATRENLVEAILAAQHEDGGWAYGADEASDPDMTAMAIQALAPYYHSGTGDIRVKKAVDKALDLLSSMQTEDGTFKSDDAQGAATSESTAQVIVALTALGINPATDARFVKGEKSAIDGLCSFWTDGGFKHTATGSKNAIATYQGYYALVSYYRLLEGKTSLYDMTDVELSIITNPVYTVTFETDGGSSVEAQSVNKNAMPTKPEDPTKAGYVFAGWYEDKEFTMPFLFDTPVTSDLTVYAKWDKIEYIIEGGGDISWTQGSSDPIVITVKRSVADETCFSHFSSVEVDGSTLTKDTDYTAVAGSTVITLKPETLAKLAAGSHDITITFDDGLAQAKVNIQEAEKAPDEPKKNSGDNTNGGSQGKNAGSPKTGDNTATLPWLFLIGISAAVLVVGIRSKRKEWY